MRRAAILAAAVGLALVQFGCAPSDRPASSADYYPLTAGSTWQYTVSYLDSTGQPDRANPIQRSTVRVAGEAKLAQGEKAMMVVTTGEIPYETSDTTYVWRAGGYVLSCLRKDSELRDTVVALSPSKGTSWHRLVGGDPLITVGFAGKEEVTVPAGTYADAWRTEEGMDGADDRSSHWYAPGVGMVRYESAIPTAGGGMFTIVSELTRVSVR